MAFLDINIKDHFQHDIIESIRHNLVTIICGETGSGKSTRVPQFLYDHGMISLSNKVKVAITQPRRIAAISLAKRVKEELNMTYKHSIGNKLSGYQVRWEHSKNYLNCPLKYMTDGILLNEMMSDKLLLNYEYIVIDEAHERKMVTDVLIGLLVKISKLFVCINWKLLLGLRKFLLSVRMLVLLKMLR